MKRLFNLLFVAFFIAFVLTSLNLTFIYLGSGFDKVKQKAFDAFIMYTVYSIPLSLVNGMFFELSKNLKNSWIKSKRIIVLTVGSVFLSVITVFIVRFFIEVVFKGVTYEYFIAYENPQFYLGCVIIALIANLFFQALDFYQQLQKKKVVKQKVIAGTANAKFDALKNQLDPHFLFNSLNVLSSLIEEDPKSAQNFTTDLSKVYRYVLEQKNKDLILLDEELKFANYYVSLLKMRFEDSIQFEIPKKAINPEAKVVPLSLQLLLENCVKHNVVTSSKPLVINISEEADQLVVKNNFQPKSIVTKGSGVGLMNIKQRYKLLTNSEVHIEQNKFEFKVRIPILTEEFIKEDSIDSIVFDNAYIKAKKQVDELKDFYYNLISYCIFIPVIIFVWYQFSSTSFQWFWFPILGWGLSLIIKAIKIYFPKSKIAKWEDDKIMEIMNQENQKLKF